MRTSTYVIYVDLPQEQDQMLLVHGYTGAYDKVSKRVATFVRSLEVKRPPKPLYGEWKSEAPIEGAAEPPSDETITVLRRRGYLTDMTVEMEEEFFKKLVAKLHDFNLKQPPGYLFMPTYNCNLRCAYCFQDYMRRNPLYQHLLRTMSFDMVDRIFKGIGNIEAKYGVPDQDSNRLRSWSFFGGEPLLASSRATVEYIMTKARALGPAAFSAITNATELEAYRDLISPEGISRMQITLDGTPAEHDKRRIYHDGSGSWEKICRNIAMALEQKAYVSVRLNIDRKNLDTLPALAEVFERQGWVESPYFSAYTAPVHAANDNVDRATTFDSWQLDVALKELKDRFPSIARIQAPDDSMKSRARQLFANPDSKAPMPKVSFCSAHVGMYIFDSFGDIYACWERTGDSSISIGHINTDGSVEMKPEVESLWRTRTVASNPVCTKCRYAFQCGGGCAVLAAGQNGKYHTNFCDGFASRFRASVAEAYVDHASGVTLSAAVERVCDQ